MTNGEGRSPPACSASSVVRKEGIEVPRPKKKRGVSSGRKEQELSSVKGKREGDSNTPWLRLSTTRPPLPVMNNTQQLAVVVVVCVRQLDMPSRRRAPISFADDEPGPKGEGGRERERSEQMRKKEGRSTLAEGTTKHHYAEGGVL
jgi:hypothetical protein